MLITIGIRYIASHETIDIRSKGKTSISMHKEAKGRVQICYWWVGKGRRRLSSKPQRLSGMWFAHNVFPRDGRGREDLSNLRQCLALSFVLSTSIHPHIYIYVAPHRHSVPGNKYRERTIYFLRKWGQPMRGIRDTIDTLFVWLLSQILWKEPNLLYTFFKKMSSD